MRREAWSRPGGYEGTCPVQEFNADLWVDGEVLAFSNSDRSSGSEVLNSVADIISLRGDRDGLLQFSVFHSFLQFIG